MIDTITKEEMKKMLEETLGSYLRVDRASPNVGYTDYDYLEEEEYNDITEDMLYEFNKLIINKRTLKIKKIKENLK